MPKYIISLEKFDEQLDREIGLEELVMCKDCKYSEPSVYPQAVNCTVLSKAIREWIEGYGCPENKDKTCPATDLIMTVFEDHYCGWGERKEDGKTN